MNSYVRVGVMTGTSGDGRSGATPYLFPSIPTRFRLYGLNLTVIGLGLTEVSSNPSHYQHLSLWDGKRTEGGREIHRTLNGAFFWTATNFTYPRSSCVLFKNGLYVESGGDSDGEDMIGNFQLAVFYT